MHRTARHIGIVSTLALALTLAGCTSGSTTKRTVTVVNTITSGAAASAPKTTSGVVVSSPSGSAKPSTTAPSSSAPPKTTKTTPTKASTSAAPFVKIDPLKADCADLLTSDDVKTGIGATIGSREQSDSPRRR